MSMILPIHIVIALSSLVVTTVLYLKPAQKLFQASYALVALTLGSGFLLVASRPVHLAQTCLSGLFYLGAVSAGIIAARYKFARHAAERAASR